MEIQRRCYNIKNGRRCVVKKVKRKMDKIKEKLKDLPLQSGVYIMKSQSGQILYVGKARCLKKRVSQYFSNSANKTEKTIRLVSHIDDFEYIITANEIEALVLENNLIKKHKIGRAHV